MQVPITQLTSVLKICTLIAHRGGPNAPTDKRLARPCRNDAAAQVCQTGRCEPKLRYRVGIGPGHRERQPLKGNWHVSKQNVPAQCIHIYLAGSRPATLKCQKIYTTLCTKLITAIVYNWPTDANCGPAATAWVVWIAVCCAACCVTASTAPTAHTNAPCHTLDTRCCPLHITHWVLLPTTSMHMPHLVGGLHDLRHERCGRLVQQLLHPLHRCLIVHVQPQLLLLESVTAELDSRLGEHIERAQRQDCTTGDCRFDATGPSHSLTASPAL